HATVPAKATTVAASLTAPWIVAFQPGRGAPATARMTTLEPLERSVDAGIRYFSGTATYTSRLDAPRSRPGGRLLLDLGRVGDLAEVRVNGRSVGTAWHAPYRLDVSYAVRPGRNTVDVR